ncbi:MAG: phage portal protein [Pirellulaceae bacterium]
MPNSEFNWSIDVSSQPASIPDIGRVEDSGVKESTAEPVQRLRRWESAETTRLNQHQWCDVQSNPINEDIASDLPTLVARCRYERYNNPLVQGVVQTYAIDVVGENGPQLIVESGDEDYDSAYKFYWDQWFNALCVDGMSGIDLLHRLIGQDFTDGDWLHQKINMDRELPSSEPVKTRLLDIDPQRLEDDWYGQDDVVGPIKRDQYGRPVEYYIRDPKNQFRAAWRDVSSLNPKPIAADDIIHVFHSFEPGQVRGFPLLASCLQEMVDLRDYDAQVLDTARIQANNGMLLYTKRPVVCRRQSTAVHWKDFTERMAAKAIPPGYEVAGQASTQPAAHYIDSDMRNFGPLDALSTCRC